MYETATEEVVGMRKGFVLVVLAAVFSLALIDDKYQPRNNGNFDNGDVIIWLGKGLNWNYQIKLFHKPNDQIQFIGTGVLKPCEAHDYAVEVSEGLIYKGHNAKHFTSFKATYEGTPAFLNPVSQMSFVNPKGLEDNKPYGMEHSACFTQSQWEQMRRDTSNIVKVSVTAYPYDNSTETITLHTASDPTK